MQTQNKDNTLGIATQNPSKFHLGIKSGIIIGLIYIGIMLIRFQFFSGSYHEFKNAQLIGYIIILSLFLLAGFKRKKELGTYSEAKDIFITLFIAILITESIFIIFNYIYLHFINPDYISHFEQILKTHDLQAGKSPVEIQKKFKAMNAKNYSFLSTLSANLIKWAMGIIMDSIVCLIFALALRKPEPKY